jgi:predicted PurR-regulated permease PerM
VQSASNSAVVWLLAIIALILSAAALRASAPVTLPLATAFFLAVLVHPLQRWFDERLPAPISWLAVSLTMLAVVGVLALMIALLGMSLQTVVSGAPAYVDQLEDRFTALRDWANAHGIRVLHDGELGSQGLREVGQRLFSGLLSLASISGFALPIFFFALVMLIEASTWRHKTERALPDARTHAVLDTVAEVAQKVRQYLLIRTLAGLISGVAAGLWLWLLGVDFALFWGVLFFLLNYVPNIGSIIAGIPPILLAFVQLGTGWALVAAAGLIAIDQVIGNYLDPRLQGRALNISSLVVLVSVIFWGWVWGIVGTLLAVPMTATILIVCAQIPALRPIAMLMSGGEARSDEPSKSEQP